MKRFKKLFIVVFLLYLLQNSFVFAQNNYSSEAIQIYNSGVAFHKQGKYEIAEQKYNQALKIQPNFTEAKNNLSMVYHNRAQKYYSNCDYNNSIIYAKKALSYNPKKIESYYLIANVYNQLKDYENEIIICNKILTLAPNDDWTMNSLAIAYLKTNQNEKSQEIYKKILLINPNDKVAQQNLKYVNYKRSDNLLAQSLNNLKVEEKAPKKIYRLIKSARGISKDSVESMKVVLDLIWSEPSGRLLLTTLYKKRIPIKILNEKARATTLHRTETVTYYDFGMVPVNTYTTTTIAVNIPISYLENFNNSNLSAYQRIYNLDVFVHEFGHAFMIVKDSNSNNSLEEEIGVSMIGYNLASKVITGEYLTREQSKEYGMDCLEGLLMDDHRDLPIYSGFNTRIRLYGIELPYPEEYSNIPEMYKKLISEGKATPVH